MNIEPQYQGQHKVSQVYLKQFGFEIDGEWCISVYRKEEGVAEIVKITGFTKETNFFDLPFKDMELRRLIENLNGKIETRYKTVISNLHHQNRLTHRDGDLLNHFVANLLFRTNPFRSFIDGLINSSKTKEKFINEITMFSGDKDKTKFVLALAKPQNQLNLVSISLMRHMLKVLRSFNRIILRSHEGFGWLTTDSPVVFDINNIYDWIIPIETEIYFPLSVDFCLYMFHPKAHNVMNPLKDLKLNKINSIDFKTFEDINMKITLDLDEFLVFNRKVDPSSFLNK